MNLELRKDPATELLASARPTNLSTGLEALADFAERAETLDDALRDLEQITGDSARRSVARLRKSLAEFEPSITLLGQVKSGKTSLVNAMAGWPDLLPSDVNPWTSVVTSLHLTPGSERAEISARFRFMTQAEWDRLLTNGGRIGELAGRAGADSELQKIREQIETLCEKSRRRLGKKFELLLGQEHEYGYFDKNLVERYICLGDDFDLDDGEEENDQGRFADITRSADLNLNSPAIPYRLCLRDTPGVNDTFMMREQVTIQAIRGSKLCVVVLSAHQALTSVDMGLIRMISNLRSRDVLIFVNRIDELADPARQVPEIEASIRQTLVDHQGPTDASIVFGSAYWAGKVLSGDMEDMSDASSRALLNWAEATLSNEDGVTAPADMVWELSGLPALFDALAERIIEDQGDALLERVASSAITIAESQNVAETFRIQGTDSSAQMTMHEIQHFFAGIRDRNLENFAREFDALVLSYQERADRAHGTFIERATHSLIEHLETYGEFEVWEYSPTGLRMLLRSAYNVFGARAQAMADSMFEEALCDVADLYCRAFGSVVEGIQIAKPTVPGIPSPVALGQTIALDFRDGWWVGWWRRTRGYRAFAKKFRGLIADETQDFMYQLKSVQTGELRETMIEVLADFFEEQKDILFELGSRAGGVTEVQELFDRSDQDAKRRAVLEATLETLNDYAA